MKESLSLDVFVSYSVSAWRRRTVVNANMGEWRLTLQWCKGEEKDIKKITGKAKRITRLNHFWGAVVATVCRQLISTVGWLAGWLDGWLGDPTSPMMRGFAGVKAVGDEDSGTEGKGSPRDDRGEKRGVCEGVRRSGVRRKRVGLAVREAGDARRFRWTRERGGRGIPVEPEGPRRRRRGTARANVA